MAIKFLLVHPEISRTKFNFAGVIENEPLELEYLSTILQNAGYEAEIFDKAVETKTVKSKIEEYQPNYLYVCGRTRQESYMKEYCHNAKELAIPAITIVGGIHAQHATSRFYCDEVDYVLASFDLFKVLDIVGFETKNMPLLQNISGVSYQENGGFIENKAESFDINRLPQANRSYFYSHLENYRYLELLPCAHVRTSYSCPYDCAFCYRNKLNCGKYVIRDIESVVQEIEDIEVSNIYFIDDDFLVDKRRIEEFIHLIKEKNIQKNYVCYGRADFIVKNPELMRELKSIGFYYVLVGLEAISTDYLNTYNKRTDEEMNANCVRLMNEIGINIMGMFILDLDFTKNDFKKLYKWVKENKLKHVAVSIFAPEFGLETYQQYEDRLITDNTEKWDYLHLVAKPTVLSVKKFYWQYYMLLTKLFIRGQRQHIYSFVNYRYYIKAIFKNIFKTEKENE